MTSRDFLHDTPVVRGAMTARRKPADPLRGTDPCEVRFTKRFLQGKLFVDFTDEFLDDAALDPWQYAEQRLNEQARKFAARNLDGSAV